MAETSLYRRHRPQTFDEVVGQEHVVRTLRNAVEQDRVHHAYLFVGSRGTGKTSMAKILARCLNCVRGPTVEPCGECESCVAIAAGTSLDVIEMDAASNRSVDDIRDLRERVGYVPAAGRWKVYIIDEAHMLTREAWNAFLKTLEEPPPNTVFVLATTEAHKVMPTILDRCQRFDFQRPAPAEIAEVLGRVAAAESIELEDGALAAIARAANGSFRDALGTLDQLVAYGGTSVKTDDVLVVLGVADAELIFAAADAIGDGDGKAALLTVERLSRSGRDTTQFIRDLIAHLRQLVVVHTAEAVPESFAVTAGQEDRLRSQAETIGDVALVRAIDELSAAIAAIREWGDDPRTALELALLKATQSRAKPRPVSDVSSAPEPSPTEARIAGTEPPEADSPATDDAPSANATSAIHAVDFERVAGLWPAVLDHVRQSGSELLSAVFAGARPIAVDAERDVLEVGFPPSAAFNKRKAEGQANRECLAEAVRTIVGESLRPVYVLLDSDDDAGESNGERGLSEDELVERLKAEFDAEEPGAGTEQHSAGEETA